MALAVELYFDSRTQQKVEALREKIRGAGIEASPLLAGSRPHISLALVDTEDDSRLTELVSQFAEATERCPVALVSLASFSGSKGILYLAPVPTARLLDLHAHLYEQLEAVGYASDPLYVPGSWVPHCTLEMGLSGSQLAGAFDTSWDGFSPVKGHLTAAGVVSYPPPSPLSVTPLKEPSETSRQ